MDIWTNDLASFKDWWLYGGDKLRRESTVNEYVRLLNCWHRWAVGHDVHPCNTPTVEAVRQYARGLQKEGRHWTAVESVRAIKTYGRWLHEDGTTEVDLLAGLRYLKRPMTSKTPTAEEGDIQKMLDACGTDRLGLRDRAIIAVLRDTGARRNEVAQMCWEHVDLANATIWIPNESAKSGRGRTVAISRETREAFRRWLRFTTEWHLERLYDEVPERCWTGRAQALSSNGVGQLLERRSALAGVDVPAHSFRRSLAVRWLREKRPETLLMQTAGWECISMVKRYTKGVAAEEALAQQRALLDGESARRRRGV